MGLIKFSILKNPKPIISGPIKNGTNYDFRTIEYKYKKKFAVQNIGEDQRLIIMKPKEILLYTINTMYYIHMGI